MRPTAKDLAKHAGVSLATVDRVLNGRPNVSKKTTLKVEKAIGELNFARNPSAANLARNRAFRFRFILPLSGDLYLEELLKQVAEAKENLVADLVIVDEVRVAVNDPHAVAHYLSKLTSNDVDGVAIMAPISPPVRDAITRLQERGIKLVQFLSGQEKLGNSDIVGVDNFAAGATAGRIVGGFLAKRPGKIMIIAETMQARDSIERRIGFDRIIYEKFPYLTCLPTLETYSDLDIANRIINRCFEFNEDIVAVYVLGSEARIPISAVSASANISDLTTVVHERTPFTEKALNTEQINAIVCQNPGHAVRSAIRIMRARSEWREPLASQENIRIEVMFKENL